MERRAWVLSRLQRFREGFERSRALRRAESLAVQLASLSDPGLQLYRFGQRLAEMAPREGAMMVGEIFRNRETGNLLLEPLYLHFLVQGELLRVLGERKAASLIAELRLLGYHDALRNLQNDPPDLRFEASQEGERRPKEPLGLRISLARRTIPRLIERFIHDPDAKVIQTILGNPRVTEAEVLKITSSPRSSPSVLATVARDHRWISRYRVKLSLVYNPNTPLRVSLGLLPWLLLQDLRDIIRCGALPIPVRDRASQLARRRNPRSQPAAAEGR